LVNDRTVAADDLLAIGTDLVAVFTDRTGTGYALVTHLARPDAGDAVDAGDRQELGCADPFLIKFQKPFLR
jgi:hypothetical protein